MSGYMDNNQMNKTALLYIFTVSHIYLAVVASYHAITSDAYHSKQQRLQVLLSWSLPIMGSLLVILVALSDREHVRANTDNTSLPTPLFRLLTLTAFSGSVGLTDYDNGSSSSDGVGWNGHDGASDGGGSDGGGSDGGGADG